MHECEVRRVQAQIAADQKTESAEQIAAMFRGAVAAAQAVQAPLLEYRTLRAMADSIGMAGLGTSERRRLEELSPLGAMGNHALLLSTDVRASAA